jgi:uncharacterized protein
MKKILFIFYFLFCAGYLFAQKDFDPQSLLTERTGKQTLVNDFSGVLTADQKQALEQKLDLFDDSTSSQVAVVIVPSLGNYDISDYSFQLGRAWGIGTKKSNNGVVLMICTDPGNHRIFIATGYGLEGALPDVTCKQIIDEVITPQFKGNDFYAGIDEGTDAIIKATKGEYSAPAGYNQQSITPAKIIFLILIIIIILRMFIGGKGGGTYASRGGFAPFLGGFLLGGGLGGFGDGGDSSGGGFGGFGGGSFGGGGAGGSW